MSPAQTRAAASAKRLRCVSFAGVDDTVPVSKLAELSHAFPFAEWALLYSVKNKGTARYASDAWQKEFLATPMSGAKAIHLCGKEAFQELMAGQLDELIAQYDRVQLNLNARYYPEGASALQAIYTKALLLGPKVILQYHGGTQEAIERFLPCVPTPLIHRVELLVDFSGGKGVLPERRERPACAGELFVGHAGAIGPDNARATAVELSGQRHPFWLDMESRIRTVDAFSDYLDSAKVEKILTDCAEFVPEISPTVVAKALYLE